MREIGSYRPYRDDDVLGYVLRVVDVGLRPFGVVLSSYRPNSFDPDDSLQVTRRNTFDAIFRKNSWGSQESRSGRGSTLAYTKTYRAELLRFFREFDISSVFDAPCGDLNWMPEVIDASKLSYTGGDLSPDTVALAKSRHPELDIREFDICADDFPNCEVWHCRDCLFHLSFDSIRQAILQFLRSNAKYALFTTHRSLLLANVDIPTGAFRWLDMERPPFALPRPVRYLRDFRPGLDFPRYVGVWERSQISAAAEKWQISTTS